MRSEGIITIAYKEAIFRHNYVQHALIKKFSWFKSLKHSQFHTQYHSLGPTKALNTPTGMPKTKSNSAYDRKDAPRNKSFTKEARMALKKRTKEIVTDITPANCIVDATMSMPCGAVGI